MHQTKVIKTSVFYSNRLVLAIAGLTCLFFSAASFAQRNDSLVRGDTVHVKKTTYHSPKKAALMSTALPGLGQAYNKKHWKIPVIYAGFAGAGYALNFNQMRYVKYRNALRARLDDDPATTDEFTGLYSNDQLNTLQQYYHRYRDLSVIGIALVYVLNIVDASVDAHMFSFDVSDDLSLNFQPALIQTSGTGSYSTGLSLNIKF